ESSAMYFESSCGELWTHFGDQGRFKSIIKNISDLTDDETSGIHDLFVSTFMSLYSNTMDEDIDAIFKKDLADPQAPYVEIIM
ncbi:hypothetical protein ABTK76_19855, partial [Acinetobacter baumannii]